MKIWSIVIAVVLILSIMTVNVFGIAGAAGLAVGGVAIATEIIVSLGISIFVGSSLKDAIQQIAADENMPVRTWVENCLTSFANSMGLGLNNFAQDLCSGIGYTNQGIVTWNRDAVNTAYDLIEYAISEYGLGSYVPGGSVSLPEQSFTAGAYTVTEVSDPVTLFEVLEQQANLHWKYASDRVAFIQSITSIPNYQTAVTTMTFPNANADGSGAGMSANICVSSVHVGDTLTFNNQGRASVSGKGYTMSINFTYTAGEGGTVNSYTVQSSYSTTVRANGEAITPTLASYNNLGGLVTGGQTDINAWDMPADVNYGWQDIADTLFDYAGTVAGYDALTGAIVDINDLINTWADVIIGAVNDVFGLDIVGLDTPIDITLDQEMVDEMEDTAIPQYTDDIDDVIEDDIDTPITGTNDEETVDPDRPFEYTGEYTLDLSEFFPFCIPFDLYNMLKLFDGEPVAPSWEWPIEVPSIGIHESIEVDLSVFDSVAAVLRNVETIAFGVGLCFATKKLIQGS